MNKTLKVIGIGVDIACVSRFNKILLKDIGSSFSKKVLHQKQLQAFKQKTQEQKAVYLTQRWAIKQAIVKATSQTKLIFPGVYINSNLKIKLEQENIKLIGEYDQSQIEAKLDYQQDHVIAYIILGKN